VYTGPYGIWARALRASWHLSILRGRASLSLLVVVAIAGCGGGAGSHDYSEAISRDISINGAQQIQRVTNSVGGSGRAIVNRAHCVQGARTQTYSCVVRYTYLNSEGTYRYQVKVSATCDSGGNCRWHVDGKGTLVGAEPD
jgi:hypothetical protein